MLRKARIAGRDMSELGYDRIGDSDLDVLRNLDLVGDLEEHRASRGVDQKAVEAAAAGLLEALGVDVEERRLTDTPRRVARMYDELLSPRAFNPTTFPNDSGYDELVLVRDIS